MASLEHEQKVLHSPFDINVHKATFINYCETIVFPNGKIEYAVPSHSERLCEVYADIKGISIDDVKDICRKSEDVPWYKTLMKETGIIFVWYSSVYAATPLTKEQHRSLTALLENGIVDDRILNDIFFL